MVLQFLQCSKHLSLIFSNIVCVHKINRRNNHQTHEQWISPLQVSYSYQKDKICWLPQIVVGLSIHYFHETIRQNLGIINNRFHQRITMTAKNYRRHGYCFFVEQTTFNINLINSITNLRGRNWRKPCKLVSLSGKWSIVK